MWMILTFGLVSMLAPFLAQADFIVNGDFETVSPEIGYVNGRPSSSLQGGVWDVYSAIPG
jgi:hypothetical protein